MKNIEEMLHTIEIINRVLNIDTIESPIEIIVILLLKVEKKVEKYRDVAI